VAVRLRPVHPVPTRIAPGTPPCTGELPFVRRTRRAQPDKRSPSSTRFAVSPLLPHQANAISSPPACLTQRLRHSAGDQRSSPSRTVPSGCSPGSTWPPAGNQRPDSRWSHSSTLPAGRSTSSKYDTRCGDGARVRVAAAEDRQQPSEIVGVFGHGAFGGRAGTVAPAERDGPDGHPHAAGRRSIAKTTGPSAEITVKPRCR
jgi:hypothetical protein